MSMCITLFVLLYPGLTKSTSQAPNQISVSKDALFSYTTVTGAAFRRLQLSCVSMSQSLKRAIIDDLLLAYAVS